MVNQVSLVEHDEPHQRISSIRGPVGKGEWHHTQTQAIENIEARMFYYYIVKDGRPVRLVVGQTAECEKFIKSEIDGDIPMQLLQLPSTFPTTN